MNNLGLLDPRLMAYLQQARSQMQPNPGMPNFAPPTNMGQYAPPMPRAVRPGGMMPPQGMMRPGMMQPNVPGMMPTNMGQYAPPMPRVVRPGAAPQNYFPAPIVRSDGQSYFPAPIIRSDVPMGTIRPGAPTRPQLPGDRTTYTVNRPFAVP